MFRSATNWLAECLATFFFVGRLPKAPGTWGSLAALPFAFFLWKLSPAYAWGIFVAVFFLGVWAARQVVNRTGTHDHQSIVIDEVLGIFLTTAVAPAYWKISFPLAFILFRLFDIWKPWPIRWVDRRWKGGLGVIMDDLVAAGIAAVVLYVIMSGQSMFAQYGLPPPDCSYSEAARALCIAN